ncbi:hypothetical protein Bbelb_381660 [Branchiostoma belcheri]|nr:hypothetical protein Bbelb_381660 [Branchiostoma belcheri]
MREMVLKSPYYSILIDETTDISVAKQLIIFGLLALAHNTNVREYKDDTRKIVKFISAPGQLVHCPFNPAHVVKCCKVEDHFRKCSKDYKGPALATCKYNRLHLVAPRDLDQHQSFCPCEWRHRSQQVVFDNYQTTLDVLQQYNIPLNKVLGLGMDGAAVMSSGINGVTGLLYTDDPFAVAVYCVCHRLHLAVSQAAKKHPAHQDQQPAG